MCTKQSSSFYLIRCFWKLKESLKCLNWGILFVMRDELITKQFVKYMEMISAKNASKVASGTSNLM